MERETEVQERLDQLRNAAKRNKQQKHRRITYSAARRAQVMIDTADNVEIDMNDTDTAMLVFLLAKIPFNSLRVKLYKIAKQMEINTSWRYDNTKEEDHQ